MALRTDNETRTTPSVLDRLIDDDPRSSSEAPKSRSVSIRELKQSVRRDLEWLLNTRSVYDSFLETDLEEAKRSVAFYGLRDITGMSVRNHNEQKKLTESLETAIRNFEPRFLDVKVSSEPLYNSDRQLKFRIEAKLNMEPVPEPITFDTVLQVGSGEFEITEK
jgi:type VI secretion system protein ImpF